MPTDTAHPPTRPDSSHEKSSVLIGWVWRNYLKKHWKLIGIAVFFMIIEGSTLGAISYMMQPMFDSVFVERNDGALWVVALVILAIFVVRAISGVIIWLSRTTTSSVTGLTMFCRETRPLIAIANRTSTCSPR